MATKTATAPKDDRLFIRITLDFFDSEKVFPLSPAAKLAFIEMIAWSARQHTDGRIRKRLALARWAPEIVEELLDSDPERPLLVEGENDYFIHDYAEHQQTTADIEAVREARRAAGRKGGLAKAAAQQGVSSKKVAKASKPLAKPAEKENEKENYKKKGERKTRTTVAAPVARCPVPDAPSPSPQIEIGLAPDGVAPATAADHPAGPEPQGEPVGVSRPVAVDPQPAVEPAPAPVLEDPWAGLPDLAGHQAVDTNCADERVPAWLNPTSEKTMTAKDQAVVAAVRAYQVIGTPAEWSSPDDPRCRKHAYLPREEVPPCRNCMRSRRWFEQRADAEKQAHLAAIHACPLCDDLGYVAVKNAAGETTGVAHCDHTGELPKPKAETQPRLTGRGMPAHLREKLDGILGRKTAQETAPEAPQKPETPNAHTDTPNHDPNLAEERSGELVAVGVAS